MAGTTHERIWERGLEWGVYGSEAEKNVEIAVFKLKNCWCKNSERYHKANMKGHYCARSPPLRLPLCTQLLFIRRLLWLDGVV